jgi:hypothetical protein
MSIYKQIFATASIFAIAAAMIVTPTASAATVSISGNSIPSTLRLCAQDASTSGTQRTDVTNGSNLTATTNGTQYNLFTTPLNNCTGANTADYTAVTGSFYALTSHTTTLSFTGNAAPFAVVPTYDNASPKYNGDTTFSVCQGDSAARDILITDADSDVLAVNGALPNPAEAFVTVSYPANGQINYRIEPKSNFYNTQNTSFNVTLNTKQTDLSTPALTTSVFGTNLVATTLTFRTISCPNGIPAKVSSSSSMSSSSMSSSVSSTPAPVVVSSAAASATAAVSSTKAIVEVDMPSTSGKGGSTVRTGGAY